MNINDRTKISETRLKREKENALLARREHKYGGKYIPIHK